MMLHRRNTGPRKAPMGRKPCPLCDEKPLCREIEQHLKAAHPEDLDGAGDLLPTTLERLMQERFTDQDRRAARKREMLGTRDATMRQARAAVSDETEPASGETNEASGETNPPVCETEPPVSGDDDMATTKKTRGTPQACAKCGKAFKYEAFRRHHEEKCDGKGGAKKAPPAAAEASAVPPPDGSAPNLAIAADVLRTQAAAYRTKAERLEAMATELEG